ncbi:MAG: hypothetical protein K0B15_10520 [Lentimicrobium sp.]|nr:hypothetical protein [Lentimicrobium sp.]
MKKQFFLAFGLVLIAVVVVSLSMMPSSFIFHQKNNAAMEIQSDNKDMWKTVDSLIGQGLPKSALELVNSISTKAEKEGDMPEFLKASLYQLRLRSDFEENFIEKYISETEKSLSGKPEPARQILHSILADLYWQYYQQNRYRVLGRTNLSGEMSEDIATWDAAKFVEKTSAHYHASFNNQALLQSVSLKKYDPILEVSKDSKKFRPTLFDFLAHRAIDFFINDESTLTRPVNPFVIQETSMLARPEVFTTTEIFTPDKLSFHYQAISLLQEVEKFHLNAKDPEPLVDATLKRLDFVRNQGNIVEKDSLYLKTLLGLEERYSRHPVSTDVIEKIASFWFQGEKRDLKSSVIEKRLPNDNYIIARQWCLKAIEKFPESDGARNCRVILQSIEKPSLRFNIDKEVVPGKPFPILVNFRNTSKVWFRLLKLDFDKDAHVRQEFYNERAMDKYLSIKPLKEWSVSLPQTTDYQTHSVEVIHPSIENGFYLLIISGNESFERSKSPVAFRDFWSSNISYISRRNEDGSGLFYVLNRNTGQPVSGVKVQSFSREYDYRSRSQIRKDLEIYTSAADGSFIVKTSGDRNSATLSFDFSLKKDRIVAENYFGRYRKQQPDRNEKLRTFFFTDRSIYRPGQIVYFKGMVIGNQDDNNRIVPNNKSTVVLYDVNGQKVSSTEVTSNKYGSFSGSFVLPASGLGGNFRIENNSGNTYFNVEEYKRPKFEVRFLPITGSYRLNEKVGVDGIAESYTGIPITDANVSYRVVRSVSYPFFRFGRGIWPPYHTPESEIANGTLTTQADGTFKIEFEAKPHPSASNGLDPVFSYTIFADVTDINGETRSATTFVQVSSKALLLNIDVPVSLNRDMKRTFKLTSTNLNGKSTPAEVTVEAFLLKEYARLTRQRRWEKPDLAIYSREEYVKQLPTDLYLDEEQEAYEKVKSVYKNTFNTSADSLITIAGLSRWEPGRYLISLSATDAFGEKINTEKEVVVFSPSSKKSPVKQPLWGNLLTKQLKAGETIRLLAGSEVRNARLHFEVQMKGASVKQEWLNLSQEQKVLEFKVPEGFSGNIALGLTLVYDNRSYSYNTSVEIPDTKHQLNIVFETFRSPLFPGGTEKWKLKITDSDGKPLDAELLAGMYDASLDAFAPHNWNFQVFSKWFKNQYWESQRAFQSEGSYALPWYRSDPAQSVIRGYDQLNWFGYYLSGGMFYREKSLRSGVMMDAALEAPEAQMDMQVEEALAGNDASGLLPIAEEIKIPDEPQIRRNLQETAFFYPHLVTNTEGEIWVEFIVPEALTRWNFMGLAHTTELRYAQFSKNVVTRKELMVTPNLPRFFREGDQMTVQTKVSNLATNPLQGEAKLQLFDAITLKPVDEMFGSALPSKPFELETGGNTVVEWTINIPAAIDAVMVRITATAGNHSDGEEIMLPVLTNRMLVTETLPLPINGNETKDFRFSKLLSQADGSTTLRNHRLTLEFTSNPAWYAVQALPYLSESTHENSDQVFNRLYANSLATSIAGSSPKIRAVFETWKNLTPDALLSNLEKNQELKNLLLEETPWLMEGRNESEQKQRVALLFDINRMATEQRAANRKLQQLQTVNGAWPWFEGMPESRYITQLIVTGFGRMHHLKVTDLKKDEDSKRMVQQAVNYLSMRLAEDYERILKDHPKDYEKLHPGYDHIQFLYAMSYLKGVAQPESKSEKAIAYFGAQARKYWTSQSLYAQGMIALWARRNGDMKTANSIVKSLREKSTSHPEMGMYWRDNNGGYFWYQAPVETHALLIELFEELGNDRKAVDQMKTWLLKQKQTQRWATSRATADAVYALLLRGGDWLQTESGVKIILGGEAINPDASDIKSEAGTAYFKTAWTGGDIKAGLGNISVSKSTEGPAWGAVYWQYFENIDKVTAHDSPLKISKKLYIKTNTNAGPVLEKISALNPVKIGQQVVVRVELSTDRDLEYVHLKDMRASGFEPVNVLSGYKWHGGLGYYENTRDAATNFFFGYLPKGTWVFEYPLVASQKGEFSNGVTSAQCMYAPEFSAHSEGIRVKIE